MIFNQDVVLGDKSNTNLPELLKLKYLPLAYHYSYILTATLDFTYFFQWSSLRQHTFLQLGCFGLDSIKYVTKHS